MEEGVETEFRAALDRPAVMQRYSAMQTVCARRTHGRFEQKDNRRIPQQHGRFGKAHAHHKDQLVGASRNSMD
jgi:hypothetical protein